MALVCFISFVLHVIHRILHVKLIQYNPAFSKVQHFLIHRLLFCIIIHWSGAKHNVNNLFLRSSDFDSKLLYKKKTRKGKDNIYSFLYCKWRKSSLILVTHWENVTFQLYLSVNVLFLWQCKTYYCDMVSC